MLRLVLDTNVWLDWLVFDDPSVAPVKAAVADGSAEIVVDEAVIAELARVLAYPFGARTLDAQQQADALARCLQLACKDERGRSEPGLRKMCLRTFEPANARPDATGRDAKDEEISLPKCADPDDQKFLELALACGAGFLLTRDDALLELARGRARPLPFRVVTPLAFAAVLETLS